MRTTIPKRNDGSGFTSGGQSREADITLMSKEVETVLAARPNDRIRMIMAASDPAALVSRLPETEIFMTIKQVGERDAVDLIELTSPDQLIHILDLDLWKNDLLSTERARLWIEILAQCGEKKFVQFFRTVDSELLVSILRKFIRVIKAETVDEEPTNQQGHGLFTLDGIYYIDIIDDKAITTLKGVLRWLSGQNLTRYQSLMESVIWDIPAEDEMFALRWRNGRLADRGIPSFDEALEIYSYVDPERMKRERFGSLPGPDIPFYPPAILQAVGRGSFFSVAVKGIDPDVLQRIQWEITSLANRVLVADGADPGNAESLRESMVKAFQTLDLGLKYLSGEDPLEARRVLEMTPVVGIFQTGFSLALRLKWKAESIARKGWLSPINRKEGVLDSPFRETFRALRRPRPLFFCEADGNERPFERLDEITLVEERLHRISHLGRLIREYLGIGTAEINRLDNLACHPEDPPLSTICLTVLANGILHQLRRLEPIGSASLGRLLERFTVGRPHPLREKAKSELRTMLLDQFVGKGRRLTPADRALVDWWLDFLMERLASSIGTIPHGRKIDPRFIDVFIMRD